MFTDAEALLVTRDAQNLEHPGGTLLEHLRRVADQLADWGASREVQLAGLCHAAYGTDGFPVSLLDRDQRGTLREAIGVHAEEFVYLYASCDRGKVYPQLDQADVYFHDRFTGLRTRPDRKSLRAFFEITAANELDVVRNNSALAAEHGPALQRLFNLASRHLSRPAQQAWSTWPQIPRAGVSLSP
jgi:hypothetical protein